MFRLKYTQGSQREVRAGCCCRGWSAFISLKQAVNSESRLLLRVRHETACGDQFLHEGRHRGHVEFLAGGKVADNTGIGIHFDLIAFRYAVDSLDALEDRQAHIE